MAFCTLALNCSAEFSKSLLAGKSLATDELLEELLFSDGTFEDDLKRLKCRISASKLQSILFTYVYD
jgi:hypothetical protein